MSGESRVSDRIHADHARWAPGLLSDMQIAHLAQHHDMIVPFVNNAIRERDGKRVVSYGLTSYGYDLRVAGEFRVFRPTYNARRDGKSETVIVDPKDMDDRAFEEVRADVVVIPPNSFVLARSVECFKIPRDVLAIVLGKSTYARCGLAVNCTPLEPAWCGHLTVEISNTTPIAARVYAWEGVAQLLFFKASQECEHSYADKNDGAAGKYMNQGPEIVLPKV
jgi:dCTP deaminase